MRAGGDARDGTKKGAAFRGGPVFPQYLNLALTNQLETSNVVLSSRIGRYTAYHFFWASLPE